MNSISVFEGRVHRLKDEYDRLCRAKEALDLEHTSDDRLDPVIEEIRDLKAVWTALSGIWSQIAELRDTPWSSVTPRKLRQSLEGLLGGTREMPSRMRQYAAFEFVQESIRLYQKSVSIVAELKSDAMRERHWRLLYKNLRLAGHYSPSQMTLGTVWDMDLKKNEGPIREVLVQASGEVALEEYIKQVRPVCARLGSQTPTLGPADQRDVDGLHPRPGQLPEQDAPDPRLGRALRQMRRAHQRALPDEALAVLQDVRGGRARLGGQAQPRPRPLRRVDRCAAAMGVPRVRSAGSRREGWADDLRAGASFPAAPTSSTSCRSRRPASRASTPSSWPS